MYSGGLGALRGGSRHSTTSPDAVGSWSRARTEPAPEPLTFWDKEGECLFPLPVGNVILSGPVGTGRVGLVWGGCIV